MRIADRYVLKSFFGMFTGSLVAISFLFTVFSVLDSLSYLMRMEGASFVAIIHYYLLQLPQTIFMTAPISALLSTMLTLGLMNQRSELTALRAAGVSLMRTAAPMVAGAMIISLGLFELGNTLVPVGNRSLLTAKDSITGDVSDPASRVWYASEDVRRSPIILRVERVDRQTGFIHGVTAFETGPKFNLRRQSVAEWAEWKKDGGWLMHNVRVSEFDGLNLPVLKRVATATLPLNDKPEDFLRAQRAPEEMTLQGLNDQIRRVRRYGLKDTAYRVERQSRFAIPLSALILALVGAPLAIRPARSGGLAVGILGAIVVGFAYFVIIAEFLSLGKGGLVPAWAAAWSANAVFGVIGVGWFLTLRR